MPTDKLTVKSYDGYAQKWADKMKSGRRPAHDFMEKPAMFSMLPNLKKKNILCIGCGTGEECASLKAMGAKSVTGIDISAGMIEVAKKNFPDLNFLVGDVENLKFKKESFDFIYSSLVMHYINDWKKPLKKIYSLLKPKSKFLFSTHNPVYYAGENKTSGDITTHIAGFRMLNNKTVNVYGDYAKERLIKDKWFGDFNVNYYHRPMSALLNDIATTDFKITKCLEPKMTEGALKHYKAYYKIHAKFPLFIIFELTKI